MEAYHERYMLKDAEIMFDLLVISLYLMISYYYIYIVARHCIKPESNQSFFFGYFDQPTCFSGDGPR